MNIKDKIALGVTIAVVTAGYFSWRLNRTETVTDSDDCRNVSKYSWGRKAYEMKECEDGVKVETFYSRDGAVTKKETY